jgi:hypothetical protein
MLLQTRTYISNCLNKLNLIKWLLLYFINMKKSILFLLLCVPIFAISQVTYTKRNIEAYTSDVFTYMGSRILFVDEASIDSIDQNVFIISKVNKGVVPDSLFFQYYKKKGNKWAQHATYTISHNGLISAWYQRKLFSDMDKNKQVESVFIYSKHNIDAVQESVHLLLCHNRVFYTIDAYAKDGYTQSSYSKNFEALPEAIKKEVTTYWNTLDKKDN